MPKTPLKCVSQHACFGGHVGFYQHAASSTNCVMKFSVFTPPQAAHGKVPVLYYLAGLTCTEETFMIKAGAQRVAAELGLMLVAPDASPRGVPLPGDSDNWDFGVGAGFYVDATEQPWLQHYRMYSYTTVELPQIIASNFMADMQRQGIFGHSMGGHGALTIGLKNPEQYRSISAFAPIVAPMHCPWGANAFTGYLGDDKTTWQPYDATWLMSQVGSGNAKTPILIDQGLSDQFLDSQLQPQLFEAACQQAGYPLVLRRHAGYDHGYYFISSFVEDHLRHHARLLAMS
ncbi:MAG: S-formylglutathione hydrolase [Steroidobacteraceae bacterium]